MNDRLIGLAGIAEGHAAEIDGLLAGIEGGTPLWTASLRAIVRKDDPPEEEDPS